MKKITLLLLLLSVLFTFAVQAQLFNIGKFGVGYFYLGPKLGGNASFNTIDTGTGTEKKTNYGYQFGGVAKLGFTDKLSIQPELIYTSKGYATNNASMDMTAKNNYKYFGLPIVVKYAFMSIKGVQVYGSGGFYTDYMTGGITKVTFGNNDHGEEVKIEDFSTYNRVDFGFSVGGGANIDLKNKDKLNVDLRFAFGTTDIYKNNSTSSSKNISIQLSAVYLVDMTKWINFNVNKKDKQPDAYEENTAPAGGSKIDREED